jgi:hypothetical protein
MSATDVFEQLFHLTPAGWVRGDDAKPRPEDAIETWKERLTQSSMHAATYSTTKMVWANPSYTDEDRAAISGRFKPPFEGDYPSPWQGYVRPWRAKPDSVKPPSPRVPGLFDKD